MKIKLILASILLCFTSFKPVETTWTAIGDSITYLNDHLDETGNRVTKGYLTGVVEQLPNIKYINQGHNGWTAIGIAKEIDNLGLKKTDVYSVLLGTNDWWAGLPLGNLDDYKNNTGLNTVCGAYRIIINKIRSLNPDAKVILITPLQRGDFIYIADSHNNATGSYNPKNGQELSQFAAAMKEIGSYEHFKVVDLYNKSGIRISNVVEFKRLKDPLTGNYKNYKYPDYKGITFNPSTDEYPYPPEAINYTYDGLHPSDKGNKKIADMLSKKIMEN
ncbi:SGNH/GDSL hydrolase family protein [Mucilaginibacter sp.]|uniref:SGNH/GDSL hydrolase family protein n=1 Tax=Mucilaginibacter sp. TaxID=1882438 RepID=UPI0025F3FD83|nr:SGNH/GDSL hydrolase family protein [Mucilaginibacter sp.]